GVDRRLEFLAKLAKPGDGFAELAFVLHVRFLAARHGRDHACESRGHGAASGSGAASSGSRRGSGQLFNERLDSGAQAAYRHLAAHYRRQAIFEDERGIEIFDLQEPFRRLLQRFLRNQPYDLAGDRNNSVARGFAFHVFEDAVDGSLLEVGEVHRDLSQATHQKSSALDEAQAATRSAHRFRDFLGNVDVGRIQEDVIGNEKFARSNHGCPGRGMHARLTEIRLARRIGGNLRADAFELTAANILQVLPFRRSRGGFIKVDGDLETLRNLSSDVSCHGDAVFDSDAVNRDKGHDVGCAHARVRTLMLGQIDQLGGLPYPANGSFLNGIALAYQGDDAAVVVGIHLAIEEIDPGNLHGFDNGINFRRVAAFGKIRNAFHQSTGHGLKDNGRRLGEATQGTPGGFRTSF